MKLSLKLSSVLLVLPIVVGVERQPSDSLYTDFAMGAGGGSYANSFYTAHYRPGSGCEGGNYNYHEYREKIAYRDAGIGIETQLSKKVKAGLRAGFIKDKRIKFTSYDPDRYVLQDKTSYIFNPHFSLDWKYFGFGLGYLMATRGIYYPSFKLEQHSNGKNAKKSLASYHFRLGNPEHIYFSVSHFENIPLISGGGYLNYGIGTNAIPGVSLWAGSSGKKPFEKESLLLKAGIKLSSNWTLNFAHRSGKSNGKYINQPIREKGFSVTLNYRFFRR
jgi:hypothetical protein